MNITVPTTSQVADRLERTARLIAPALAFAITVTLLLVQLAYDLGYQLGQAVHERNDQLSALWVQLLADAPAPQVATVAPVQHPVMALADELEQLTQRQLMALTGCRRKISKTQLIAMALA